MASCRHRQGFAVGSEIVRSFRCPRAGPNFAAVFVAALLLALLTPLRGSAQAATAATATKAAPSPTGWTGFEEVQYGFDSPLGNVIIEDTDLGYALTDHLTVDIGLPVIWTRNPFSPVINHDYYWSALMGEPYLDMRYSGTYKGANYTSVLTGTIPAGNEDKTYVTGRVGVDWFNHVEEPMGKLTPFINFGASNGTINQFIIPRPFNEARPYETLGLMGDAEGGFDYKIDWRRIHDVKIGASYYALIPGGPQKVFSRLVFPYSVLGGDGQHHRYFDSTFETTVGVYGSSAIVQYVYGVSPGGISSIDKDNGFSTWLDITRWHPVDVQIGYTRSVHYLLNVYTVNLTFDARNLVRSLLTRQH
jgi:hypothetical protein